MFWGLRAASPLNTVSNGWPASHLEETNEPNRLVPTLGFKPKPPYVSLSLIGKHASTVMGKCENE